MQFHDYYRTLGVERGADQDQIRKAFRKLARQYHPDLSKEADAEAKMQEINEAYAVLSDPEKRAAYDQLGSGFQAGQDFRPPPDWGRQGGFRFSEGDIGGADFSDFFSELFGRMGGGNGFGGRAPSQGRDHHAKIEIDLEDAFIAPSRQLTLRIPQMDGQGRVHTGTRTLNLKIPRGVCAGQMIRLAGQGTPGPGGMPAGDLLLEVHFKPHPEFRVDGRDLHKTLALAPWEAALGAVIEVKLPDGAVKVRIPAGAQSGQQLRVRGKGIPGARPGDLLLELAVKLPPADTPQARQLYETMARELAFDPRR